MNRKELTIIAKALFDAKPQEFMSDEREAGWMATIDSVKEALIDEGHLVSVANIERFEGISTKGIKWESE